MFSILTQSMMNFDKRVTDSLFLKCSDLVCFREGKIDLLTQIKMGRQLKKVERNEVGL